MSEPRAEPDQLPVTVEEVNAFIEVELPFAVAFGIRCEALSVGSSLLRWRHDLRWTRPGGEHAFISGPVMMTMADLGIYVAIFTLVGITPLALTNELRTNFLRPAYGGDLLCRSHIVKAGRRLAYGTSDLYVDGAADRLVAQSSSTYVMPEG